MEHCNEGPVLAAHDQPLLAPRAASGSLQCSISIGFGVNSRGSGCQETLRVPDKYQAVIPLGRRKAYIWILGALVVVCETG